MYASKSKEEGPYELVFGSILNGFIQFDKLDIIYLLPIVA